MQDSAGFGEGTPQQVACPEGTKGTMEMVDLVPRAKLVLRKLQRRPSTLYAEK